MTKRCIKGWREARKENQKSATSDWFQNIGYTDRSGGFLAYMNRRGVNPSLFFLFCRMNIHIGDSRPRKLHESMGVVSEW